MDSPLSRIEGKRIDRVCFRQTWNSNTNKFESTSVVFDLGEEVSVEVCPCLSDGHPSFELILRYIEKTEDGLRKSQSKHITPNLSLHDGEF